MELSKSGRVSTMNAKDNEDKGFWKALIVTVSILLVAPLPFAFCMSGIEWILKDWKAVPTEFWATYLVGLVVLLGGIDIFKIKEHFENS